MPFPTIPAGQYADEAIGAYDDFIDYLNAVAAAVDASAKTANNLDDLVDAATARTNLGLGTMAVEDATDYAALAGATFTGAVITPASASGGAGFRLPHGDAPSSPTNGDVWTTTSAMLVRLNGNSRTLATTTDLASYAALAGATFTGHINVGVGNATYRSRSGGGGGATPYWLTALSTGKALATLVGTGGTALVYDNSGSFSINSESRAALDGDSTTGGTVRSAWSATGVLTHYNQLFVDGSSDAVQFRLQGTAGQTQDLFRAENSAATVLAAITSGGLIRWVASSNEQTTVGAPGAASALPATPTKYLKVVDSAGTTLVIPAYAAA